MRYIIAILSTALLIAIGASAQAQSLADMAEKEKQRREEIKETPEEITNNDVSEFTGGSVSVIESISSPSAETAPEKTAGGETSAEGETKPDSDEPVDLKGRSESFWRETMAAAHKKIKDLEDESKVLTLKMNDLENQFYNIDDGFNRDDVQREIQKTYYLQDQNKENLAKAKEDLDGLQKDARGSGAPPGWLD